MVAQKSVLQRISAALRHEREHRLVTWGALITHIPVGLTAYFGNFFPYLYSYFYVNSPETVRVYDPLWVASSWRIFTPVGMFIGGLLESRLGSFRTLALSGFLLTLSLFLSFFAIDYAAVLMVTFGLMCGIATGMNYSLSYKLINVTAGDKKGLYSGFMGMISNSCDALIVWLTYVIINPTNEEPDGEIGPVSYYTEPGLISRVPYFFIMIGAINFICQLVGSYMVKDYKPESEPEFTTSADGALVGSGDAAGKDFTASSDFVQLTVSQKEERKVSSGDSIKEISLEKSEKTPFLSKSQKDEAQNRMEKGRRSSSESRSSSNSSSNSSLKHNYSITQVIKSKLFYAILILVFFFKHTCYIQTNLYKQYGQLYIPNDELLTYAGVASQILAVAIRIFNGIFIDRYGSKTALVLLLGLCCFFMALMPPSLWYWAPLYIGLAPIESALAVLNFQQVSIFVFDSFGPTHFSALIGLVHIPQIILAFVEPELIPYITESLDMGFVFMTGAAAVFLALLMALPMPDRSGA